MKIIENKSFDEERALYGEKNLQINNCKFDGELDGESALKESNNIKAFRCYFNLRYPFWHDNDVEICNCEMTEHCRAAVWYTNNIKVSDSSLCGIKAFRECKDIEIENCHIKSPEFGWSCKNFIMKNTDVQSEYFMMRSSGLSFDNVSLNGKYSFQYIENCKFENCNFNTKDAFWHAKNVTIKDSNIKGEYLAWYCENLTFENCVIEGTQPFCYCKNLKLINCKMIKTDLAFEKSQVKAEITNVIDSIKNPKSGYIKAQGAKKIIIDDKDSNCQIIV